MNGKFNFNNFTNIWVTLKSLDGHTIRGIFKNRHLSNATGRIRDESLINQGGRVPATT
jgi:hypothetical protein